GELLDWQDFSLVLPDLDRIASPYDLSISPDEKNPVTRVEMPWGIYLAPANGAGNGVEAANTRAARILKWVQSPAPTSPDAWSELWNAGLVKAGVDPAPGSFEIVGVRGFKRDSTEVNADSTVVRYLDDPEERIPQWLGEIQDTKFTSPIVNNE